MNERQALDFMLKPMNSIIKDRMSMPTMGAEPIDNYIIEHRRLRASRKSKRKQSRKSRRRNRRR